MEPMMTFPLPLEQQLMFSIILSFGILDFPPYFSLKNSNFLYWYIFFFFFSMFLLLLCAQHRDDDEWNVTNAACRMIVCNQEAGFITILEYETTSVSKNQFQYCNEYGLTLHSECLIYSAHVSPPSISISNEFNIIRFG